MIQFEESLVRYVDFGLRPGSFLEAVLKNDLFGAMGKADLHSRAMLYDIVSYCYNELPSGCYGSAEKFEHWVFHCGLKGIDGKTG